MRSFKFNKLETERLILRRFQEKDAKKFFQYRTDPIVSIYQGGELGNYTYEETEKFVCEQMNFEPGIADTWFQIAVALKATGELIGDVALHTLSGEPLQAEVGYTISPDYQKMGYGLEAVKCLLGYAFNELDFHRIVAITDTRNNQSYKLLEKIGMRKEAHFIKNSLSNGKLSDEFLFAILKEEWKKQT